MYNVYAVICIMFGLVHFVYMEMCDPGIRIHNVDFVNELNFVHLLLRENTIKCFLGGLLSETPCLVKVYGSLGQLWPR